MRLFMNSCSLEEIREAMDWGFVEGLTMNPKMIGALRTDFVQALSDICRVADVQDILAQVVSTNHDEIVQEAQALAAIDKRIVVKVHANLEGYRAMRILKEKKIRVCATAVHSVYQSVLSEKVGADIVAIFTATMRLTDENPHDVAARVRQIFDRLESHTQILNCVHTVQQFAESALAGADIVTMDFDHFKELFHHPLTALRWDQFITPWKAAYGERTWLTGFSE